MKESPQDVVTAPYGTWSSPLGAAEVAAGAAPIFDAAFRGDEIFYSTKIPAEKARTGLVRTSLSRPGEREQVIPTGFNIRSAVHEYGGASWALDQNSEVIYFVNAADQRVWQIIPGRAPHALTPDSSGRIRYGDLRMSPWGLLCVREDCRATRRERAIVLLTKHGTTNVLSTHSHFMAWPRLSPDGSTLAFIGWEHPNMPWDGTTLWLVDVRTPATPAVAVLSGDGIERPRRSDPSMPSPTDPGISLLQPEFTSDSSLHVISDHQGHWSLFELDFDPVAARPLVTDDRQAPAPERIGFDRLRPVIDTGEEIGGALWQLGTRWHLNDGDEVWAHSQAATATLVRRRLSLSDKTLTPSDTTWETIDTTGETFGTIELLDLGRTHLLLTVKSTRRPGVLYAVDRATGLFTEIASERLDTHQGYYSRAQVGELGGVPVVIHPPHNPRFAAPVDELPPFVVSIHGGPTGQATPEMTARTSFFTSQGIGVLEVNYGGSTGFGRAWRDRLRGGWGVIDVEDTVAAVNGLVAAGLADPNRIAISGASSGGWTVLSALASTNVFACGTSYFGVTDLMRFVVDTHDFESHYIDGLVGPWPAAQDEYITRSPIRRTSDITVPVAVMQGDRDPIVPPSQAQEFVDTLELAGVEYIYRLYKGESHGFVRAETIIDSLESEFGFYVDVFGIPRAHQHG
ncbi:Prolyl oligopeptidase family protein [Brevibacterium iodinum ATCC 49514]|uniref:Prolyl oligopeptidase family protein n=1 Tax=Brevibacterium iodinum ATCC 49514 TaxID=1255616 RepID=A0A2H1IBZ0_9MICO|nr:prolyl oligopeptidase family serine peptidase [Brevibacterium iodinum]SMX72731.1 Prolyl oligopeptidase family protein [Brevibacterium iodinum ATCC 49514]SUW13151.1 Prolyl tripeptidyl peptidase precursor [Brevibacterium iodinum]